jgi:hypothetical protein
MSLCLADQARFTDAGIARDQQHLAAWRRERVDQVIERGYSTGPTDQDRADDRLSERLRHAAVHPG